MIHSLLLLIRSSVEHIENTLKFSVKIFVLFLPLMVAIVKLNVQEYLCSNTEVKTFDHRNDTTDTFSLFNMQSIHSISK